MKKTLMAMTCLFALSATAAHANHWEKKDTNGDGQISKSEAQAFHDEKFKKMDTNGDGVVTKEEAKAAKDKWKAEHKNMKKK
jgi:EF hand